MQAQSTLDRGQITGEALDTRLVARRLL